MDKSRLISTRLLVLLILTIVGYVWAAYNNSTRSGYLAYFALLLCLIFVCAGLLELYQLIPPNVKLLKSIFYLYLFTVTLYFVVCLSVIVTHSLYTSRVLWGLLVDVIVFAVISTLAYYHLDHYEQALAASPSQEVYVTVT